MIPEGAEHGRDVAESAVSPTEAAWDKANSLSEMRDEYAFFTPGVLYSFSRFDRSVVTEFMAETGWRVRFVYRIFPFPLFHGLGAATIDDDWNRTLFGISREGWDAFRAWCHTVSVMDQEKNEVIRLGVQMINIMDPLVREKTQVFWPKEIVQIGAICVDGASGCYAFDPDRKIEDIPTVTKLPVRKDTAAFMASVFGYQYGR